MPAVGDHDHRDRRAGGDLPQDDGPAAEGLVIGMGSEHEGAASGDSVSLVAGRAADPAATIAQGITEHFGFLQFGRRTPDSTETSSETSFDRYPSAIAAWQSGRLAVDQRVPDELSRLSKNR